MTDFILTPGAIYKFKVESRNEVGYSQLSDPVPIQAMELPDQPEKPTVVIQGTNTIISWREPLNGGAIITSYSVTFFDGANFVESPTYCIGNDQTLLDETRCEIPSAHFTEAPFNLNWSETIYAKVTATNQKGDSPISDRSNGVQIFRVPDAPLSLVNVADQTTAVQIGVSWTIGVESGGTPVLDYRVSFD
jgi:hypothetical protein